MAWARGRAGNGHAEWEAQQEDICRSSAGITRLLLEKGQTVCHKRTPCSPTVKLPSDAVKTFSTLCRGGAPTAWVRLRPRTGTKSSNPSNRSTTWSPTRLGSPTPDEHTPRHRQGEHDAWANDEELMLQL